MAGNAALGTGWADTWDPHGSVSAAESKKGSGGGAAKYGKKVGAGLEKTKVAAASGMKKGIRWVKEKYHKTAATNHKPR